LPDAQPASLDTQLRNFFDEFSRSRNALDLATLGRCFDEVFLAADATGTKVVPRPAFLQALPRRAQMFADAGIGQAVLESLTHQELDGHYVLVRTAWTAPRTDGSGQVDLASSFLLRRDGDQLRIVAYITHEGLPQTTPP